MSRGWTASGVGDVQAGDGEPGRDGSVGEQDGGGSGGGAPVDEGDGECAQVVDQPGHDVGQLGQLRVQRPPPRRRPLDAEQPLHQLRGGHAAGAQLRQRGAGGRAGRRGRRSPRRRAGRGGVGRGRGCRATRPGRAPARAPQQGHPAPTQPQQGHPAPPTAGAPCPTRPQQGHPAPTQPQQGHPAPTQPRRGTAQRRSRGTLLRRGVRHWRGGRKPGRGAQRVDDPGAQEAIERRTGEAGRRHEREPLARRYGTHEVDVGLGRPGDHRVGDRPEPDAATVGLHREGRDQPGGQAERFGGDGGGVRDVIAERAGERQRPGHRPLPAVPLLDGGIAALDGGERAAAAHHPPARRARP